MLDLTPFMIRLTKAATDRVRLTIYVAPGRADDLRSRLQDMGLHCWTHSDTTLRVEEPESVYRLLLDTYDMVTVVELVTEYVKLRKMTARGQERSKKHVEQLKEVVNALVRIG